jgi:drug/metabolite transporter (DMT)-like permease
VHSFSLHHWYKNYICQLKTNYLKPVRPYIYLLVILSMVFWGMSFVWTTIVFNYLGPLSIVFVRLVISSVLLFSVLKISGKLEPMKKADYKLFAASAFFNPFLYFLGESYGVKFSSPTISAVIIATIPVFSLLAASFFLKEKLSWLNILGMIISFSGILIMLINRNLTLNSSPIGILCLLFAVFAAIGYSILLKRLSGRYSAFSIITYQNMIGAVLFAPLALTFDLKYFIMLKPDFTFISSLLFLSVFASSLAFVFYAISTREMGVSRTNVFSNFIPVFTAIFSFFIIGESLNAQKIAGMFIVIFGVVLSQINKRNELQSCNIS